MSNMTNLPLSIVSDQQKRVTSQGTSHRRLVGASDHKPCLLLDSALDSRVRLAKSHYRGVRSVPCPWRGDSNEWVTAIRIYLFIYLFTMCESHSELSQCSNDNYSFQRLQDLLVKFPDPPELQAVSPVEMLETEPSPKNLPPQQKNGCKNHPAWSTNEFLTRISPTRMTYHVFRWDHNLNRNLFSLILRGASQVVSLRGPSLGFTQYLSRLSHDPYHWRFL